ncbi:MAG: ABC transporter permease [Jiangellaceae bacterium]|nr:ABC transporter permease [Jiangellaceae bacterium]
MTGTPKGAIRAPARPSALRLGVSRAKLELKAFFRERDALIFAFFFPIIMLAIFSVVFGREGIGPDAEIDFTQYFLPGMIAAGIMLVSFQTLAITIAIERDDGTLKRLLGTPMPPVAYFLGKIGLVLVTSIAQTALLLAYAALMYGVDLPTEPARWLTFGWVFLLGAAAGTVLGIAFSSVPKSARSAPAVVTTPMLILQFISGVFFVFNDLPTWLQQIASIFPLKWLAQGMRSVFLPREFEQLEVSGSWQHGLTAVILAVWLILGLIMCIRTFRWQRRDAG